MFGMSGGYEQVSETPQAYQPPGFKKASNPLDLKELKSGISGMAKSMAQKVGVDVSSAGPPGTQAKPKTEKLPEHLRPPSTTWDQKPGTVGAGASAFQRSFQNSAPAALGPGGVVAPRNGNGDPYDPANAPTGAEVMNLGNKYAKSYSSSNPPPRPGDERLAAANKSQADEAKSTFMDELGMDKEPTRKERKKKMAKIAEDPGILVAAAGKGAGRAHNLFTPPRWRLRRRAS